MWVCSDAEGDCTQADGVRCWESSAHCTVPRAISDDVRCAVAWKRCAHEQGRFIQAGKEGRVTEPQWVGTGFEVETPVERR